MLKIFADFEILWSTEDRSVSLVSFLRSGQTHEVIKNILIIRLVSRHNIIGLYWKYTYNTHPQILLHIGCASQMNIMG